MKTNILILIILLTSCSFLGRPPSDIVILVPQDNAEKQQATIQLIWQCENADIFKIYFGEIEESLAVISEQTASSYELTGLLPRTTYYWKIAAENNVATKETPVITFSTGDKPDPVINLNWPKNGDLLNEPDVQVSWEMAAFADSYLVEVAFDSLFIRYLYQTMVDDTYFPHDDFPNLDTLYWRVQSWNSFGPAAWSPTFWFYVKHVGR
ncbi:MAG: hypothetical protein AB7T10_04150 [bacterium]